MSNSLFLDARFGLRMLRKHSVVTAAAVLSLSLAIGACTAAFSLIDALILRPLPVHDPAQLIALTFPGMNSGPVENSRFSQPLFERFRDAVGARVDFFEISLEGPLQQAVLDDSGGSEEKIRVEWVSGNTFGTLGVQPALGRLLTVADDPREPRAVVLSHGFWIRRFGGSAAVLGRRLTLNDKQFQIVGVAQQGFSGLEPGAMTDLWVPIATRADAKTLLDPDSDWAQIWGRLKPGVEPEQLRQILQATFTNFRREQARRVFPSDTPPNRVAKFINTPLRVRSAARGGVTLMRFQFERPLWIVGMIAVLVLLIAGSNVANLFIARAAAREHEMAMRISIGARRGRLFQQMVIESGLVAGAACAMGLAVSSSAAPAIVSLLAPVDNPAYLDLRTDWRVLGFLALAGVLTTVLFGMAPALRASRVAPNEVLKAQSDKHSGGIGMLRPLLTAQVGFSFAVLFVAGLLLLSFQKLTSVDLGFSKSGIVLVNVASKAPRQAESARVAMLALLDRVRQVPGVQAAGMSAAALGGGATSWVMAPFIRFPGRETEKVRPYYLEVSPGFFETMQIRIFDGRDFVPRDTTPASAAVIVNQAFARRYFPGDHPLGKRFERLADDPTPFSQEIVGVVGNAKYNNVREPALPIIYAPLRKAATLEVRTAADPLSIVPALREEIQRADPGLHVTGVTLQSTRIDETLLAERLLALLAGFFAVVAVVLAAVGLYGVLSYSVVRRTKEIGIRMALGAKQSAVVRLVMTDITLTAVVGLAAGLACGMVLARFAGSILFEVKPADVRSIALPVVCLLLASVLAALPPLLGAARVDPTVALRAE